MDFLAQLSAPDFWAALLNIILVNIVLSGDNAVLIALAAQGLPAKQQKPAIMLGSAAAVAMRAVLTVFAIALLKLPYLKLIGGILLVYIAVKLLVHEHSNVATGKESTIVDAIKTILVADLVMSLDNVLGVAAASHGNWLLLIIGLALSVPLIVFGSTLVMKVMQKFRIIVVLGAALLGYLGGEMFISDIALHNFILGLWPGEQFALPGTTVEISLFGAICALAAIVFGMTRVKMRNSHKFAEENS
jgi:YjbE family integral membrane protein